MNKSKEHMDLNRNSRTGQYQEKGFTLYETLIYLAVFAFVVGNFVSLSLLVNGIRTKNYLLDTANYNLDFINQFLSREIKRSDMVAIPAPGKTSDTLLLSQADGNMNIELMDGGLVASKGQETWSISTKQFDVDNLSFRNMGEPGEESSIKYGFDISARADLGRFGYSTSVYGTCNTR